MDPDTTMSRARPRLPSLDAVCVRQLRKQYGSLTAVGGIDLSVEAGEIFGFLGPNGAGKTTTIEILEGYRLPDEGSVSVLGLDPAREGPTLRQRIGVMLQETALPPYITAGEALDLFAGYYHRPVATGPLLESLGLRPLRDRRVKTLSGGQRRRLDLGLALVGDPELLFLDEPTVGFDPQARHEAWDIIREQRARGRTVFLTTQAMDEAEALCDRIAIIERGAIIALDTPRALRETLLTEVRITFECASSLDLDLVRALPGVVAADARGEAYRVLATDPTAALHELTAQALARGTALRQLHVSGGTLEDVFLQLTGREVRP